MDLAACINDLAIANVHEVEMTLANTLIVQLSPHVLLFFDHLQQHETLHIFIDAESLPTQGKHAAFCTDSLCRKVVHDEHQQLSISVMAVREDACQCKNGCLQGAKQNKAMAPMSLCNDDRFILLSGESNYNLMKLDLMGTLCQEVKSEKRN